MTVGPTLTDGLVARATSQLYENDPIAAELLAREALALTPRYLPALNTLAFALHAQGKHRASEEVYLQMTVADPTESMHWMNVGTARRCDDRLDEALYAFARAAALGANTADFYYNVALAHIAREDYASAFTLLQKAHLLDPSDAEIRYRYAYCCYETQRTDDALAALAGWEQLADAPPELAAEAGHLMMKLGEIDRAEPAVRSAAAQSGADPQARLTLIQLLERTNKIAEARSLLDRLRADPESLVLGDDLTATEAKLAQRESQHEIAVSLFKALIATRKEVRLRHFQQFPLAKSLDGLGRYDEAFETLTAAHESQLAYLEFSAPLAMRSVPSLVIADHSCDAADIAHWEDPSPPSAEKSPIFIVGFPRSGTTLLELVLDAHPRLQSIDEQPFLQNAVDEIQADNIAYPAGLAALQPAQLERIRRAYWERTSRRVPLAPGQRLIDKNPLNILRLPAIKRLFPNAKIILAIRHPCDVLLSCFMQHFRAPDFVLLCQSIPSLAQAYRKTFDYWYAQQALLQADALELKYEAFVADFEAFSRRIFDFLGVPWDEAVLLPARRAEQKRYISTPSYSQVIEPINSRAVNRWRRYEAHFASSLSTLNPYLERWGY